MAKLNKGLLSTSGISGRIGDLIYYTRNGKQYVRSQPRKCARKVTKAQMVHRDCFGAITRCLKPFTPVINLGFQHPKDVMTPFNYALSYAFKNALTGDYPYFRLDFCKMLFTHGRLTRAFMPMAKVMSNECIHFTWHDISCSEKRGHDRAVLIALAEDPAVCFFNEANTIRYEEIGMLRVPGMAGKKVHTYIGFISVSGKQAADSIYTGELTVE